MTALISEQTNLKLDELVTMLFAGNRLTDAGVSELDVHFCMPKTSSILHAKFAHALPMLGDAVSDFQASRNNKTIYGVTPKDGTIYSSPLEFFQKLLAYMIELESLVYDCYEVAKDDNDFMTKVFLESFILKLAPYTKQCLLLTDKAEIYGGNFMGFDHRIEDFMVI